ncbi:MAG: Nif3-like dinuclear metal center hexameric protein [Bacteroidia bacterium]|nr:Nif3-like dinuclear metal center hexameric protein [Bacteroidia bacterium]
MRIGELIAPLEAWAPPELAENYDNVGLLLGDPEATCTGALCTLDVTLAVLDEAEALGCNLILAHHPAWFRPRNHLRPEGFAGRVLYQAARRGLHLYAIHTNLDNIRTGVNAHLAQRLGLMGTELLAPKPGLEGVGSGAIGTLPTPLLPAAFVAYVAERLGAGFVHHTQTQRRAIARVAVCGGSGSFLLGAARAAGADALVTADITYHTYFETEGDLLLCDVGHYTSEVHVGQMLVARLNEFFPTFALRLSSVPTNPVTTYTPSPLTGPSPHV